MRGSVTTVIGGDGIGSTALRGPGAPAVAALRVAREERWEVPALVAAAAFSAALRAVQIELAVGLVTDVGIIGGVVRRRRRGDPLRAGPGPLR